MKFRNTFLLSHDIDWFCKIGELYIHGASFGGAIPHLANDEKKMAELLLDIYKQPINQEVDIFINEQYLQELNVAKEGQDRNNYLSSFMEFAKRGFYSYDRRITSEDSYLDLEHKTDYVLIACPKQNIIVESMFPEIPCYNNARGWIIRTQLPQEIFNQ